MAAPAARSLSHQRCLITTPPLVVIARMVRPPRPRSTESWLPVDVLDVDSAVHRLQGEVRGPGHRELVADPPALAARAPRAFGADGAAGLDPHLTGKGPGLGLGVRLGNDLGPKADVSPVPPLDLDPSVGAGHRHSLGRRPAAWSPAPGSAGRDSRGLPRGTSGRLRPPGTGPPPLGRRPRSTLPRRGPGPASREDHALQSFASPLVGLPARTAGTRL